MADAAAEAQRRELLLRELQHRVKNNFQIILSSIGIQKRRFENIEIQRALDHVANRINAISLAHDQLSPRHNVHAVDVASYLRALSVSIEQQVDKVAIEFEADEIELSIDRAVPLGLILTKQLPIVSSMLSARLVVRSQSGFRQASATARPGLQLRTMAMESEILALAARASN